MGKIQTTLRKMTSPFFFSPLMPVINEFISGLQTLQRVINPDENMLILEVAPGSLLETFF